jgi:hypothetical protein
MVPTGVRNIYQYTEIVLQFEQAINTLYLRKGYQQFVLPDF